MSMDRMQKLQDAIDYAVKGFIEESDDSAVIYAKTDAFMEKVNQMVYHAVCQASAPTWQHDGVTFHLVET